MKNLYDLAFFAATFGPIGSLPAARIWVSALGVPLLLLAQFAGAFAPLSTLLVMGVLLSAICVLTAYVRRPLEDTDEEIEGTIVLDRIVGVVVALAFQPQLSIKIICFGFFVFHLWLFISALAQRIYAERKKMVELVILDTQEIVLLGVLSNLVIRLLWWIMH